MATRRVLSLVVALVTALAGYFALFTGGVALVQRATQDRSPDVASLLFVAVGILVLAIGMLTIAFSSTGAIVLGLLHLLVGVLGLIGIGSPLYPVIAQVENVNEAFGAGLYYTAPTGIALLVGSLYLCAGLAARSRKRGTPSTAARVVSVVLELIAATVVVPVLLGAGFLVYATIVIKFSPTIDIVATAIVIGSAVVFAVVTLTLRWSSAGALLAGLIATGLGVAGLLATSTLAIAIVPLSQPCARPADRGRGRVHPAPGRAHPRIGTRGGRSRSAPPRCLGRGARHGVGACHGRGVGACHG